MGDAVLDEGRVGEGGGAGGFDAAPVVHVHVHDHAPLLHLEDRLAVYQGGRAGADHVDSTYKEVRAKDGVPDAEAARRQGRHVGQPGLFEAPQPVQVPVYDHDRGSEAARHPGRAGADDATAEDDHAAWPDAGGAAQQDATAPELALQVVGAYLRGEATGDLAHRRENG